MVESRYPMLNVESARSIVLKHARRTAPAPFPLLDAVGLVLAETVRAEDNMPPFPASAMDGFAVVSSDRSRLRRVVGEQLAGEVSQVRVESGTAARITTGAPLPAGADAVVMVEDTEERGDDVMIHADVEPGENVRSPGIDIEAGQVILDEGTPLHPAEIGLLATVGRTRVTVHPPARVAVLPTGDELVEIHETPSPGQIRDSNRYSLLAAVQETGAESTFSGIARDDPQELHQKVTAALDEADVLLTSGGVSMGEMDLVKPLLETLGTVHFGRVRVKPGKPLTFATVEGKLLFGLPGNPVSSLVTFELFVRPALLKMQGHTDFQHPKHEVVLSHNVSREVSHTPNRTEFQRAVVTRQGEKYYATTTGSQASSRLLSMAGANALLRLPPGQNYPEGSRVEALFIGEVP